MTTPTPEAIADTLAYYHCRRVNPKADDPIFGYHTFSEDQREFLRGVQSEAAAEIHRMLATAAAQAKGEALREAAEYHAEHIGLYSDWGDIQDRKAKKDYESTADWLRARADTIAPDVTP